MAADDIAPAAELYAGQMLHDTGGYQRDPAITGD
jgi:hypothetical protein